MNPPRLLVVRNLPSRTSLSAEILDRLQTKTKAISAIVNPEQKLIKARKYYDSTRESKWFRPVVDSLRNLSGEYPVCMYCSSNEPSQLDHYRPISVFPEQALQYENFLWICDICNRTKQNRFPPTTEPGEPLLNPIDDNVWDHFFLDDQFGRLIKRINPIPQRLLSRAETTCSVVRIDREELQKTRKLRYRRLKQHVTDALGKFNSGLISLDELREELALLKAEPFQADVADYFLNGPGKVHEPFHSAVMAAEA